MAEAEKTFDLLVVGRGMAGMAAALFAAGRGLSVAQVGRGGQSLFASGLLDLMAVHPVEEGRCWDNPWAAIEALVRDIPEHPYARLERPAVEQAFLETLRFLGDMGLPYRRREGRNAEVLTAAGTTRLTFGVPASMWSGVRALEERWPCLIAGFEGIHDFSALQIVSTLTGRWPGLRAAQVPFPAESMNGELARGEILAERFELSRIRERLVELLKPLLQDARAVGLPAVIGLRGTTEAVAELAEKLGVPVFEIPTPPVSVPGLRLQEAFQKGLSLKGVRGFPQDMVHELQQRAGGGFEAGIGRHSVQQRIRARGVVLATGRFGSRGLAATRSGIREALLGLPVWQPRSREEWHRLDFLDPRGHPANRAGLRTDEVFRPLDETGRPAKKLLFAAGSILAHQDWMRMKCGSGLAITSAWGAVHGFLRLGG